ncbi:MAG: 2-oxoglutarate dehydrogenase E1 component [Phycisphaerales bacterium JB065]
MSASPSMSNFSRPSATNGPQPAAASLNGWNATYLEAQYEQYRADPGSVGPDMRDFFRGFELGLGSAPGADTHEGAGSECGGEAAKAAAVRDLVNSYRSLGHTCARIDPFDREREAPQELNPTSHGLSNEDLGKVFTVPGIAPNGATLSDLISRLDEIYCGHIGVEVMHITNREEREWWLDRVEANSNHTDYTKGERFHILEQLHRAEMWEKFCGKRYPGQKRFSLEGGESLIPLLDRLVEQSADTFDVEELVLGMSHRGRLNVLVNIMGKTYEEVFTEFDDTWEADAEDGGGDVKYHRGYSSNRVLPSGKQIWLAMASNPSHLEAVGPVVLGRCRAKQRLKGDKARKRVVPIVMHGDAAVIGQGVVAEMYNCAGLEGYTVGGTIHIVVNNQIGFTTGPQDGRTSRYCTDIAKMIEAPVLHVNGEDPEAVVHCAQIALEYRMRFKKDVVIDMQCYRRHGHNETDEAMFTQPLLYSQIKKKPTVLSEYANTLMQAGVITQDDVKRIESSVHENLDEAYTNTRKTAVDPTPAPGHVRWTGVTNDWTFEEGETAVDRETLYEIAKAVSSWPEGFKPHRKLIKVLEERTRNVIENKPFDWATAEAMAIGSLVLEGNIFRLTGQDSRRGTFSHRHAVLRDVETAEAYVPINAIRELVEPGKDEEAGHGRQNKFCVYDSPLSEFACLGFEYGFSLASPKIMCVWEAQFGDFSNGAQVIIDQFISSAELKWQRWTALTLLLPHGYEGQGPEHSSARLERFLKLCGQNNMQVCYPSTPAQYFHMLRRQMHRSFRKPLIVMSPKSLLRLPACTSTTDELTTGGFKPILDDPAFGKGGFDKKKVSKVLLCTGKVYYDLLKRREQIARQDVAIVRVEQLYPLHIDLLKEIRASYPAEAELAWVQEEPKNMGAYGHIALTLMDELNWTIRYYGRPSSGTPATGSPRKHLEQLNEFLTASIGTVHEERSDSKAAEKASKSAEKNSKSKSSSGTGSKKSGNRKAATA